MLHKVLNFIVFFICIFTYQTIFADTKIELIGPNDKLNIGDQFNVSVKIETDSTGSLEIINIDGLESFKKVGQNSSNSLSVINGKRLNAYNLQLYLTPVESGVFKIGPTKLQIGNQLISSNIINLTVNDQIIKKEDNKDKISNISNIEDIKGIKNPNRGFYNFILIQIGIISLLIGVYIYYAFFLNKKNNSKINEEDIIILKKKKLIKDLIKCGKNIKDYNKSTFYTLLNSYFREYFSLIGVSNSDILTLSEIKKLSLNTSLVSLFEKSYLNEFNDKIDSEKERLEIIDKLIKLIRK